MAGTVMPVGKSVGLRHADKAGPGEQLFEGLLRHWCGWDAIWRALKIK